MIIRTVLLLAAVALVLASCNDNSIEVGCRRDQSYVLAKYNRTCVQERSDGYFRVPAAYVAQCEIVSDDSILARHKSSGSALRLAVPLSDLDVFTALESKGIEGAVRIAVRAGEESRIDPNCFEEDEPAPWDSLISQEDDQADSKRLRENVTGTGPHEYKIEGYRFPDDNEGIRHDIFIRVDPDQQPIITVRCNEKQRDCHFRGTLPVLDGRYGVSVSFPYNESTAAAVFGIIDSVPKFMEGIYITDKHKEGKKQ